MYELNSNELENVKYAYWLDNVPGIGKITRSRLLENRSMENLYKCSYEDVEGCMTRLQWESLEKSRESWDIEREWEKLVKRGIQAVEFGSQGYPEKLAKIPDAPFLLYCKGNMDLLDRPAVAVVGTRECSAYGSLAAKELGRELAKAGFVVVSGMARGIDGICQWSALESGGSSIGVLGSGVEVCYPKENRSLYERLQKEGCLISENPPFTGPAAGLFPLRNRMISGLSDVVAVIEAREKSGTLITVDMALEQGREVYALPGRITENVSRGCNKLIKQGAGMILSPREFVEEIAPGILAGYKPCRSKNLPANLTKEEIRFFDMLTIDGQSPEDIWMKAKKLDSSLTLAEVMKRLMGLCKKGVVECREQYYYRNVWQK